MKKELERWVDRQPSAVQVLLAAGFVMVLQLLVLLPLLALFELLSLPALLGVPLFVLLAGGGVMLEFRAVNRWIDKPKPVLVGIPWVREQYALAEITYEQMERRIGELVATEQRVLDGQPLPPVAVAVLDKKPSVQIEPPTAKPLPLWLRVPIDYNLPSEPPPWPDAYNYPPWRRREDRA